MCFFEKVFFPFTWVLNHTFYYLFSLIFWLIDLILPDRFTTVITEYKTIFWNGIVSTVEISLFGTLLGLLIAIYFGTLLTIHFSKKEKGAAKVMHNIMNGIIQVYTTVFRGTPMIVQAMIIYYGFLKLLNWKPFDAALVTVTINTGAYLTEVIKSGIESIDKGQMEGARALGFSYFKSLFYVVFPQALKNSMASIGNEFVINIKDTSVLNVIGCVEMYYVLTLSSGKTYFYMETMITGAIIYFILTFSFTKLLKLIEKKMDCPTKELPSCN